MRRVLFDVPKWSICLHRWARGLDGVDRADPPALRVADELFERVYQGPPEPLPGSEPDEAVRTWAERVHTACGQLPAFERLAAECRCDADAAGLAVETLLGELHPHMEEPELRRAARAACVDAATAVEKLRDAVGAAPLPRPGRSRVSDHDLRG